MPSSHATVGLVLLVSVVLMIALAICAWVGVLPIPPESQKLAAIVLGIAAGADAVIALVLLTRS